MEEPTYALFLNGGYGVGKTSVLDCAGDLLADAGRSFSLMDVDWFHRSWPPALGDRGNTVIEADNMAAVWRNYLRSGPRQLVISGVISSRDDRDRYERALGLPVRSVRLEASSETTMFRLRCRYAQDRADTLQWHLDRYEDLAQRLESIDLDELAIATDGQVPRQVAELVLRHFDQFRARVVDR